MGVGTGLYMCDVVKKCTFAISSPDEFLFHLQERQKNLTVTNWVHHPRRPMEIKFYMLGVFW